MNRKQMCIANLRYKRPGASEARQARNLLGYLTYRESRDEGVKLVAGMDRWADHGMGGSVGEIVRRCGDLRHLVASILDKRAAERSTIVPTTIIERGSVARRR